MTDCSLTSTEISVENNFVVATLIALIMTFSLFAKM